MTKEELQKEVLTAMKDKPQNWRKGQFIFNYIDAKYGVARSVQFECGIDCFYNDETIDAFIEKSAEVITKYSSKNE